VNASISGLMPPCMQISVAPRSTASCTWARDIRNRNVNKRRCPFAVPSETTELAADETDVGEVDVPVHDVADVISHVAGADVIGGADRARGHPLVTVSRCARRPRRARAGERALEDRGGGSVALRAELIDVGEGRQRVHVGN